MDVPHGTVERAKREYVWVSINHTKYCQVIYENDKAKRLELCKKMLNDKECFDDVIGTDESSVTIDPCGQKRYRRIGENRRALKTESKS